VVPKAGVEGFDVGGGWLPTLDALAGMLYASAHVGVCKSNPKYGAVVFIEGVRAEAVVFRTSGVNVKGVP
jgi:hypothetical protein